MCAGWTSFQSQENVPITIYKISSKNNFGHIYIFIFLFSNVLQWPEEQKTNKTILKYIDISLILEPSKTAICYPPKWLTSPKRAKKIKCNLKIKGSKNLPHLTFLLSKQFCGKGLLHI